MIQVQEPGPYIILTVNGSYVVETLSPGTDYSHMVQKIVQGPFADVLSADSRWRISGHRLATQKLSEHLSSIVNAPAQNDEALQHDLDQIRVAFSGDARKLETLISGGE